MQATNAFATRKISKTTNALLNSIHTRVEFSLHLVGMSLMIPKTAEYALRTVACLAGDPERSMSADHLAERTKVPRRYLNKVLQDLIRADLVQSRPGPGGGYSLASPANEMTLLKVVNAVAPLERIHHCPLGLPNHTSLCPLHRELDRAYAATEASFARVTIGQLSRTTGDIIPLGGVIPRQEGPLCDVACS